MPNINDFDAPILNDNRLLFQLLKAMKDEINALRTRVATLEGS